MLADHRDKQGTGWKCERVLVTETKKHQPAFPVKNTSKPAQLPDDLIKLPEAAALATLQDKTMYRMAARGFFPSYKLGARVLRFSRREVLAVIAKHRIAAIGEDVTV